jgi:hypothetical protein
MHEPCIGRVLTGLNLSARRQLAQLQSLLCQWVTPSTPIYIYLLRLLH